MSEQPAHYGAGISIEQSIHQSFHPLVGVSLTHRDIVLLLPEFRSLLASEEREELLHCMQLVMLLDGTLGFCNILTPVTCYGCDRPVCEVHVVPVDEQRDEEEREGVLL